MNRQMHASPLATAVVATLGLLSVGAVADSETPTTPAAWRANTFTSSTQAQVTLGGLADGSIVTAWSSRRQQGGRYGVYLQRFDAHGTALGPETPGNIWMESHQMSPALDASGSVAWLAWQSFGQDGDGWSVLARRFHVGGDGALRGGDEVLVNGTTTGAQSDPVIAATPGGGAIVAWIHAGSDDAVQSVRARRLDAAGAPSGDEIVVCGPEGAQGTPALAVRPDGSGAWAAAFTVIDARTASSNGVWIQRFDAQDERVGDATLVAERGIEPDIVALGDGWLVAWLEATAGAGADYSARVATLDAGAQVISTDDVPRARGRWQSAVSLATAGDDAVLAWCEGSGDGRDVVAMRLDRSGRPIGSPVIAAPVAGDQWLRAASAARRVVLRDEAIYVAWAGDGGFGDDSAAHVSVISDTIEPSSDAGVAGRTGQPIAATGTAAPHEPPMFDPRARERRENDVARLGGGGEVGFTGIFNTGWTPPDPHLAVGPEHVVVMTNGAIAFFTKDGSLTFDDVIEGPGGFWGSVGASTFVFDPEAVFDPMSGRFFVMAADRNSATGRSYALVAVSDDSDPNGTWYKYRFDTTALAGPTFDSPNIGVSSDVVYITGDGFGGPRDYPIYTFDKASLLNGAPPAIAVSTWLDTSTQSAGIPPVSFDDPPAIYMIEHEEGTSSNGVRLIAMSDPLGTPSFTTASLTVPTYGRPEDPPQSGTSVRPETFDARFWSCAYRNGSLWATHHADSSRVLVRWYEIAMNGWPDSGDTPELVQSGVIDPGAGVRTFFSAITVDDHGNAAVVYARSSPSEFFSMATSQRSASDPPGTMQAGVIWQTATGPYTASRWGDYAAVNVDPVDGRFWAHHEYSTSSQWRTWVQAFAPSCLPEDVNCDGVVDVNDLLTVLAAWGPCPGCPEDIDGDGAVGVGDLLAVLAAWGP